ncbi:MAG TPA: nucleoside hydrolase [Nitrospiraceae bacterium]|nr:nucleoside hydrolase [Nitrospiraceae bacterium]
MSAGRPKLGAVWALSLAILLGGCNAPANTQSIPTAVAPTGRPLPTTPAGFEAGLNNLALRKQAIASASLPDQPPSAAVDGDLDTFWSAGTDAPQWIEVDMGSAYDLERLVMVPSQYPNGPTVHHVWGRGTSGDYKLLQEFRGSTADGVAMEASAGPAWPAVRYLKIETSDSPSWVAWREIEVYGQPAAASPTPPQPTPGRRIPVVLLQDGAPDDISAAMYLMLDESVNLAGIVVVNGETRPSRALAKWEDYVYAYMGWNSVQVVAGCDCAVDTHANQFPASWRDGADNFWGMTLPEYAGQSSMKTGRDLISELAGKYPGELVVVITGPHTDLALALAQDPTLKGKIAKVVIMGGAVQVGGNIKTDDPSQTNLTAEWNIWVDAQAAAQVFESGIPLDIIPMDPVPEVELHSAFSNRVRDVNRPGANLMATLWTTEFGWYGQDYIWIYDVLAAIAVDHPEQYTWVSAPVSVITEVGPDQGRTVRGEGTSDSMRYASHANEEGVLETLYSVFPLP